MLPIRRILVPIDWSKPSLRAFDLAATLAQKHDTQLVVLYVVPLPTVMYGPPPESYLEHLREELLRLGPTDPDTRIQHLLSEGDPARAILQAVRDNQCDMIVMGTHGRTGVRRLLMGSVAEEVVRKAPCPVITVKALRAKSRRGRDYQRSACGMRAPA
jgi:nucleotide-binding universal stress UspA family protein